VRFSTDELAVGLDAQVHGPNGTVTGVSIDSRGVQRGELFVALRAERDGHEFVSAAISNGAGAVLVDHVIEVPSGAEVAQLVVPDTTVAMQSLATVARDRLGANVPETTVIGITGSVGKTTTKDLLAAVLSRFGPTAASVRSFNNELGVPLTLSNAPDDAVAAVVEMGARGKGHIALLCRMARPAVGVITTVEAVHTEVMGDVTEIAAAKQELIESLPADGLAVLNSDNALVAAMAQASLAPVVTFGAHGDVRATDVAVDDQLCASFTLVSPWGSAPVRLGVRGVHNVANALAAAAVALAREVPMEMVVAGLAEPPASPWRMELSHTASGAQLLNDSYNAGPASMAAALRSVASLDATRHVAILGVMAELGDRSAHEHAQIAALAAELGVEIIAVGTDLYGLPPVDDVEAAVEAVLPLSADCAVLVKGSRVAGLERVAAALAAR